MRFSCRFLQMKKGNQHFLQMTIICHKIRHFDTTKSICDAIWRKTPKWPKIDSLILNALRRFELALQDGIVKKIPWLIIYSVKAFKHCRSGEYSRLLSRHVHMRECCHCEPFQRSWTLHFIVAVGRGKGKGNKPSPKHVGRWIYLDISFRRRLNRSNSHTQ